MADTNARIVRRRKSDADHKYSIQDDNDTVFDPSAKYADAHTAVDDDGEARQQLIITSRDLPSSSSSPPPSYDHVVSNGTKIDSSADDISLPIAENGVVISTLEPTKDTDFDDILRLINPFGRWQKILVFTAPFIGAWPFVLLPAFIAIKIPHYCNVPTLQQNSTWSQNQIRNLSIPQKEADLPPAIGQAYEPCKYYSLPYDELAAMSFEAAYARRLELAASDMLVQKTCDNGWQYDTNAAQYRSSIQVDFDLVCKREPLLPLSFSAYMVGMLLGVIFFGAISDRYGRRRAALISAFLLVPVLLVIPFSPNYWFFLVTRFLLAFLLNGHFISVYVLVMEIIGPEYRAAVGFWQNTPFYIGYALLAPMAYWMRDSWRWFHAVQNWPLIMLVFYYYYMPESPRWLITQGRYTEARDILEKAAKVNGRWPLPVPLGINLLRQCHVHCASIRRSFSNNRGSRNSHQQQQQSRVEARRLPSTKKPEKTKYGRMSATLCLSLLRTPEMRQRTVLSCFLWFSICTVYYGMAFYAVKLDGNIFVNFFLMGIVALPAYGLSWVAYQRYGRKPPLIAVLVMCGIFCCAIGIIDWFGKFHDWHLLVLICATAGKFFMTGAFGMIYVYSAEIFPTVVRNVGISSNSMIARIGSASSPYINDISDIVWHPLPMLMYGVLSIFTALTTTLLPETHNADLVETIDGIEMERELQYEGSVQRKERNTEENEIHSSNNASDRRKHANE